MAQKRPFKQVRIEESVYQDLQIIAAQQDRSVTWLINHLLKQATSAAKIGLDQSEL